MIWVHGTICAVSVLIMLVGVVLWGVLTWVLFMRGRLGLGMLAFLGASVCAVALWFVVSSAVLLLAS